MPSSKRWFPLEANPEVMQVYLQNLGLQSSSSITFSDVFGLDDDVLQMVPRPVLAVLLLYPITPENDAAAATATYDEASPVFFTKQTISNACGTIGLLHALLNNCDRVQSHVSPGSVLENFVATLLEAKTPAERAAIIEGSDALDVVQADAAQRGDSANQDIDADIHLHFVCLIQRDGQLLELDGRRRGPHVVGPCTADTLLEAAAAHVRENYVALNPDRVDFNLVAMCVATGEQP